MQTITIFATFFVFDGRFLIKPTSFCNYRPMLRFFKSAPFRRFRFREEKVHFRAKLPPNVLRFIAWYCGQKSSVFFAFPTWPTLLSAGRSMQGLCPWAPIFVFRSVMSENRRGSKAGTRPTVKCRAASRSVRHSAHRGSPHMRSVSYSSLLPVDKLDCFVYYRTIIL